MPISPFDDQRYPVRAPRPTRDGCDTSGWDQYRQGVEITTDKFRFLGTQPKLWSGNLGGATEVVTYGQTKGAEEGPFLDLPKFDPVSYISMGTSYPIPIQFNDGPLQQDEAFIEPFAIPFRKPSNEGPFYAHAIRGELEDGNNFDSYTIRYSSKIEQLIEITTPPTTRGFLDEGGGHFGNILKERYLSDAEKKITPFDDLLSVALDKRLQTTNPVFISTIHTGIKDNASILPYGKKSAGAGWTYYGLNCGQYGTDSIAFGGWSRGS